MTRVKITSSYRQNRTRLFLPIKGNQDISKASVLRWVSYSIKLARRDISFLKIKAHEVRALSSSWAFFDKVPLNKILKAAVWNQSSTFAKFYLRDISTSSKSSNFGPNSCCPKSGGGAGGAGGWGGVRKIEPLIPKED